MNTLIVIESLTIVNLLNKVQFPFVKVFPPQMLSSSSEGAIVQAVPIAFAPVHGSSTHKMPAILPPIGLHLITPGFHELQWLKMNILS